MMKLSQPEDVPAAFAFYWNARDPKSLSELFVEDADFINVVGIWWKTREDIFKAHKYGLEVIFKDSDLKLTHTSVRKLSGHHAVVIARMRLKGQSPVKGDSALPAARFNHFTFVVEKSANGRWVAISAHNTDIIPGKETNIIIEGKMRNADYRG